MVTDDEILATVKRGKNASATSSIHCPCACSDWYTHHDNYTTTALLFSEETANCTANGTRSKSSNDECPNMMLMSKASTELLRIETENHPLDPFRVTL